MASFQFLKNDEPVSFDEVEDFLHSDVEQEKWERMKETLDGDASVAFDGAVSLGFSILLAEGGSKVTPEKWSAFMEKHSEDYDHISEETMEMLRKVLSEKFTFKAWR